MGSVQSAIAEQREAIRALFEAVNDCPSYENKEAWQKYQDEVMEPLRAEIRRIKDKQVKK